MRAENRTQMLMEQVKQLEQNVEFYRMYSDILFEAHEADRDGNPELALQIIRNIPIAVA